MSDVRRFTALKEKAERLRSSRDKLQGNLDKTLKDLKKEFGVGTVKEAEKYLKDLEKEVSLLEKKFNNLLDSFEEKWGEKI